MFKNPFKKAVKAKEIKEIAVPAADNLVQKLTEMEVEAITKGIKKEILSREEMIEYILNAKDWFKEDDYSSPVLKHKWNVTREQLEKLSDERLFNMVETTRLDYITS